MQLCRCLFWNNCDALFRYFSKCCSDIIDIVPLKWHTISYSNSAKYCIQYDSSERKYCARSLCHASVRRQISSLSFALCQIALSALFYWIAIVLSFKMVGTRNRGYDGLCLPMVMFLGESHDEPFYGGDYRRACGADWSSFIETAVLRRGNIYAVPLFLC